MLTTARAGRNLVITVDGVDEPFIVPPLPGNAGREATYAYLQVAGGSRGDKAATEISDAMAMCIDGGRLNPDDDHWYPNPPADRPNFTRIGNELREEEGEAVLMVAFFWQSILGDEGVRLYLEGGAGTRGSLRALVALVARVRAVQQ